jgi:hypothetical protein
MAKSASDPCPLPDTAASAGPGLGWVGTTVGMTDDERRPIQRLTIPAISDNVQDYERGRRGWTWLPASDLQSTMVLSSAPPTDDLISTVTQTPERGHRRP